jgi:hypothetical protein
MQAAATFHHLDIVNVMPDFSFVEAHRLRRVLPKWFLFWATGARPDMSLF